jgi:hypothetical protein
MKPLAQIASQVSKVEVTWPSTLPLPRISPLLAAVANKIPELPPFQEKTTKVSLNDMVEIIPIRPTQTPTPTPTRRGPVEPIFESVVEGSSYQGGDFTQGLIRPTFE